MTADSASGAAFERAMAIEPLGGGRYAAVIGDTWDGPVAPIGGVIAAIMVRAVQAELGRAAPAVRTVSAHFLEAPSHGRAEIRVEVLRTGKRVSVCDVRMRQRRRLAAQVTVICSAARVQEAGLTRTPPPVPALDHTPMMDPDHLPGAPPFVRRLQARPAFGALPFAGAGEAVSGGWLSLRDDPAPLDPARLIALSDLWLPAIFSWLNSPAGAPTLQLTVYLRSSEPAVRGPVLARFETRTVQEGHFEEDGELWSPGGSLLAESHQLALWVPRPAL